MTRYTVVWDEAVESNFLDAWLKSDAPTRAVLTEVANTIDRTLAVDAETGGELQSDGKTRCVVVQVSSAIVTVFS